MPTIGLEAAWLLPALPLVIFVVVAFGGRWLPAQGAPLAVGAVGLALLLFGPLLASYRQSGAATFERPWMAWGDGSIGLGMTVDALAIMMLGIVTFVSLMVQVYSLGYMKGDPRFGWFFAVLSLFTAAMLGLVLANDFVILYVTWELVGLCSYLLIGFWYERPAARDAAKKAFVVTRLGDVGLLLGIVLLWRESGTFNLATLFEMAEQGRLSDPLLTVSALLILAGAIGKSAQFPLHVWLPDAMEGPTPVSALIHAATMVAAGVYLVARTYPLFQAAPLALSIVAILGLLSALLAGVLGLAETDLKRVLAYSTISQLGFMMVGLGSQAYTGALFHLFTHAFFKALLFLAAGSVLHALGTNDLRQMGGLLRRMPVTGWTFLIGALALAGIPPMAGFWSKDEILRGVAEHWPGLLLLAYLAVGLTALYTARAALLAFFGRPRSEAARHAHESPAVMTVPLVLLGVASALAGLLLLPGAGTASGLLSPYRSFGEFLFYEKAEPFHLDPAVATAALVVALGGLGFMGFTSGGQARVGAMVHGWLGPLPQWATRKFYLDDLYQWMIDRIVLAVASLVALFDRKVVNDVGVNGTASLALALGERLRYHITGHVYSYALLMVLGVALVFVTLAVTGG